MKINLSEVDKIGLILIAMLIASLTYYTVQYGNVKNKLVIEQQTVVKLSTEIDSLNGVIREIEMFSAQDSIYREEIIALTDELTLLKRKPQRASPKFNSDTQLDGLNVIIRHKLDEQFKEEQ
jgi:hypothetical protein